MTKDISFNRFLKTFGIPAFERREEDDVHADIQGWNTIDAEGNTFKLLQIWASQEYFEEDKYTRQSLEIFDEEGVSRFDDIGENFFITVDETGTFTILDFKNNPILSIQKEN